MFQGKENRHTFLGLAWVIHDLLMKDEGFWFFILYHPGLDVSSHSYLTITNRFLSLLFHVDVVEQIRAWVITILHLFSVSHQLFLNQTINSYPITWWCSVLDFLIYFLLGYSSYIVIGVDFSVSYNLLQSFSMSTGNLWSHMTVFTFMWWYPFLV